MNPDVFLTLGVVLAVLTVPAFLSALADSRSQRTTVFFALTAAGCIGYAVFAHPEGYTLAMVPDVLLETFARLIK